MRAKSIRLRANVRIEMQGLSRASGGRMMLTRLPSVRQAFAIGLDLSNRRPPAPAPSTR
jgi:hypothetical protein